MSEEVKRCFSSQCVDRSSTDGSGLAWPGTDAFQDPGNNRGKTQAKQHKYFTKHNKTKQEEKQAQMGQRREQRALSSTAHAPSLWPNVSLGGQTEGPASFIGLCRQQSTRHMNIWCPAALSAAAFPRSITAKFNFCLTPLLVFHGTPGFRVIHPRERYLNFSLFNSQGSDQILSFLSMGPSTTHFSGQGRDSPLTQGNITMED